MAARQLRIVGLVAIVIATLPAMAVGQLRLRPESPDAHGTWWEATEHNTVLQIDLQPGGTYSAITYHRSGERVQVAISNYLLQEGELTLLDEHLPQRVLEQREITIGGRDFSVTVARGTSGPYALQFANAGEQLVLTDAGGASRVWTRYPPPHFGLPAFGYGRGRPDPRAFPWLPSGRIDDAVTSQGAAAKLSRSRAAVIAGLPASSRSARSGAAAAAGGPR